MKKKEIQELKNKSLGELEHIVTDEQRAIARLAI